MKVGPYLSVAPVVLGRLGALVDSNVSGVWDVLVDFDCADNLDVSDNMDVLDISSVSVACDSRSFVFGVYFLIGLV